MLDRQFVGHPFDFKGYEGFLKQFVAFSIHFMATLLVISGDIGLLEVRN